MRSRLLLEEGMMGEESRENQRFESNIEILYESSGAMIQSHTLNISNGGLFLETEYPLPVGSEVTLRMVLPGETEPIEIQGCVVWSNPRGNKNNFPSGMGIQFRNRIKIDVFG
jgi:type IV pilus assembly protein PilZ